ncbi:MAG: hypothetical protein D8M56_09915 [Chloroflexi bacterium]|nr:hypothetical protein [Chloroflexota bacterium]
MCIATANPPLLYDPLHLVISNRRRQCHPCIRRSGRSDGRKGRIGRVWGVGGVKGIGGIGRIGGWSLNCPCWQRETAHDRKYQKAYSGPNSSVFGGQHG